jgi:hypothetical protein
MRKILQNLLFLGMLLGPAKAMELKEDHKENKLSAQSRQNATNLSELTLIREEIAKDPARLKYIAELYSKRSNDKNRILQDIIKNSNFSTYHLEQYSKPKVVSMLKILKDQWEESQNVIKGKKFTSEDDQKIWNGIEEHGTNWLKIAEGMPGRSPLSIRNRYFNMLKYHKIPKTETKPKSLSDAEKQTHPKNLFTTGCPETLLKALNAIVQMEIKPRLSLQGGNALAKNLYNCSTPTVLQNVLNALQSLT